LIHTNAINVARYIVQKLLLFISIVFGVTRPTGGFLGLFSPKLAAKFVSVLLICFFSSYLNICRGVTFTCWTGVGWVWEVSATSLDYTDRSFGLNIYLEPILFWSSIATNDWYSSSLTLGPVLEASGVYQVLLLIVWWAVWGW